MKHSTRSITTLLFILWMIPVRSQDTFSIVAVDSITGEVGSAGASCVDLFAFPGYATDFLGDLIPGVGAINTQAYYLPTNQVNARNRMLAGDTPSQIIQWLVSNDAQSNPAIRQYGIAAFVIGVPQTAAHTGTGCQNYKDHITGSWYSIQGNILLGQQVLDSMESRLLNEPGDLACKLMAALQGANIPGADSRCLSDSTSSLFAFLKVSQPSDPDGSPSLVLSVKTHDNSGIEPIDTLQTLFDAAHGCAPSSLSGSPQSQQALLFPNPAKQAVTVRLIHPLQSDGTYRIIDRLGRQTGVRGATRTEFQIDCSDLKSGIYFLEINSGDSRFYKKLIID